MATEVEVVCPACAKHKFGQETGVIYSLCEPHTQRLTALRAAREPKPVTRLVLPPPPPNVAKFNDLFMRWRSTFDELRQEERNLSYWKIHSCHGDSLDCFGCDKESLAMANVGLLSRQERTLRTSAHAVAADLGINLSPQKRKVRLVRLDIEE